jgi:hypothetical protein
VYISAKFCCIGMRGIFPGASYLAPVSSISAGAGGCPWWPYRTGVGVVLRIRRCHNKNTTAPMRASVPRRPPMMPPIVPLDIPLSSCGTGVELAVVVAGDVLESIEGVPEVIEYIEARAANATG